MNNEIWSRPKLYMLYIATYIVLEIVFLPRFEFVIHFMLSNTVSYYRY
jgi:hypothetical protein